MISNYMKKGLELNMFVNYEIELIKESFQFIMIIFKDKQCVIYDDVKKAKISMIDNSFPISCYFVVLAISMSN